MLTPILLQPGLTSDCSCNVLTRFVAYIIRFGNKSTTKRRSTHMESAHREVVHEWTIRKYLKIQLIFCYVVVS